MRLIAGFTAWASVASAALLPVQEIDPEHITRDLLERDTACTNGPLTRACWNNGYSIATDFDLKHPTTGNTVKYTLTLTNGTCNPDGHGTRVCLLINNQYPGPPIVANWGDMVDVTVINKMQDNGTSIHWHGVRQLNSCGADGVPGITQCPSAPGSTYRYLFQATQFGTSWYHSHYSTQYGDGIVGPIIFNGPASANYDIDLGTYPMTDWYYKTAFQIDRIIQENSLKPGPPPSADNVLINGTNKDANGNGKYSQVSITQGKKYRLRLINTAVDNYFRVSLDNHVLQVMTSDFSPVKPYYTNYLLIAIGQRYDVVINANQTGNNGNYWFRAQVAGDCLSANAGTGLAIWTYTGYAVANPTTTAWANPPTTCVEPLPIPFWNQPVPSNSLSSVIDSLDLSLSTANSGPDGALVGVWALNTSSLVVQWDDPTLSYLMSGNTSYPSALNVIPTFASGKWNYWIVQQTNAAPPIPHPIHLHGHDFFVLGQGSGQFNLSTAALNFQNPPRRDTATLYGGGWLAFAFVSNNPGAWLMHCHISWHISAGLGVQFVESPSNIVFPDKTSYDGTCNAWDKYYATAINKQINSGL